MDESSLENPPVHKSKREVKNIAAYNSTVSKVAKAAVEESGRGSIRPRQ
jgi:hypothetical protein